VTSTAPPEIVCDTIADLRNHLDWSGERASSETFNLLSMEAPEGLAEVGTAFSSSGAADNGTFHDHSVVTEASRPRTFVIETDSHLDRSEASRGTPISGTGTTSRPKSTARGSPTRRTSGG
jgi:hypothetical protein